MCIRDSSPAAPQGAELAIESSYAGMLGSAIQPLFAPLGFSWEICIALIPGLAAREVAVSALATVYALSGSEDAVTEGLGQLIAVDWSMATAFALLAWYVFAPQCLSTIAVIKRETNSWKITLGTTALLFALAYLAGWAVHSITVFLVN